MKGLDMGWDAPSGLFFGGDGYLGRWPRLTWVAPLAPGEGVCGGGWCGVEVDVAEVRRCGGGAVGVRRPEGARCTRFG